MTTNDKKIIKQPTDASNIKTAHKTKDHDEKDGMEVRAILRYLRMSPRKVRAVVDVVKKMPAGEAVDYLKLVNKAASLPLMKLVNSAISNGVKNFQLPKENLYIKNILVNEGPPLKRYRPRAHGRATLIKKRSSHIEVILGEIESRTKGPHVTHDIHGEKEKKESHETIKTVNPQELKQLEKLSKDDKTQSDGKPKKRSGGDFVKRIFNRKTG